MPDLLCWIARHRVLAVAVVGGLRPVERTGHHARAGAGDAVEEGLLEGGDGLRVGRWRQVGGDVGRRGRRGAVGYGWSQRTSQCYTKLTPYSVPQYETTFRFPPQGTQPLGSIKCDCPTLVLMILSATLNVCILYLSLTLIHQYLSGNRSVRYSRRAPQVSITAWQVLFLSRVNTRLPNYMARGLWMSVYIPPANR